MHEKIKICSKKIVLRGWLAIIAILLGLASYFGPKWLSDDIKVAESIFHIPVVDFDDAIDDVEGKTKEKDEENLKAKSCISKLCSEK